MPSRMGDMSPSLLATLICEDMDYALVGKRYSILLDAHHLTV